MYRALLSISIWAVNVDLSCAQPAQFDPVVQIDCSAYQRHSDGRWTVLRTNKITPSNGAAKEVTPIENTQGTQLANGSPLRRNLDLLCASFKR
ncbi:hypothetical protein ACVWZ6_001441 [Bradyrhizobium sp. GM6.1]